MCVFFAGLCALAGAVFVAALIGTTPDRGAQLVFSFFFAAFAVWAVVSMVRGLKTNVREFSYDGRLLQFRTLTCSAEKIRERAEIAEIRRFEGRGGSCGYCLRFRDGQKIYFDNSSRVAILAEQLRIALDEQA
jgi:hypothetical protein